MSLSETNNSELQQKPDYAALANLSIWQLLARQREAMPEREAVVFANRRVTFGELANQVERVAASLFKHGLRKGDMLALLMPNWTEFLVTFYAAARLGAVIVPLNIRYRQNEIEYILRNSESKFLVTCAEFGSHDYIALINRLRPGLPNLEQVIVVGQAAGGPGLLAWESLLHEPVFELPEVEINPKDDLFMLLYTSGTTGLPKGAMLTHYNIAWNSTAIAEALEATLAAVPLFHVFGVTCCATPPGLSCSLINVLKAV